MLRFFLSGFRASLRHGNAYCTVGGDVSSAGSILVGGGGGGAGALNSIYLLQNGVQI